MQPNEEFQDLSGLLDSPTPKGLSARLADWSVGPGNLGCHLGFLVGTVIVTCHYWIADADWNRELFFQFLFGAGGGWFGGGLGGLYARDEFLRPEWARCRPLTGLMLGSLLGCLAGVLFLDVWIALAGLAGGGIGGVTESFVYRDILEDLY